MPPTVDEHAKVKTSANAKMTVKIKGKLETK